jgi:hypothetical protein
MSMSIWKKTIMEKDNWFEDKKEKELTGINLEAGKKMKRFLKAGKDVRGVKTSTVMFVPSS